MKNASVLYPGENVVTSGCIYHYYLMLDMTFEHQSPQMKNRNSV